MLSYKYSVVPGEQWKKVSYEGTRGRTMNELVECDIEPKFTALKPVAYKKYADLQVASLIWDIWDITSSVCVA